MHHVGHLFEFWLSGQDENHIFRTKTYFERSGKGLINSLGIKTIRRSKRKRKAMYAIKNVILKEHSKIIKEFEDFPYEDYVWKKSKHVPTES